MRRILLTLLTCLLTAGCASHAVSAWRTQPSAPPQDKPGRWILVTAPAFADALEPLKKHRQAEGFDVVQLKTTDLLSPDELQKHDGTKLLARLRTLWQPDPPNTYILLVGVAAAPTAD